MNRNRGILLAIASAIVYGLYPPAARAVYAAGGNPMFMIVATALSRALGLGFYCALSRKPLFQTREDTKQAVIGGFFQALSILAIFASLVYLPGPVMIIVLYTHTLMLLFFMAWRGDVKLDAVSFGAAIIALGGLSLVLDVWHPGRLSLIGLGLALVGAVTTMGRLYVYGHLTKSRNPAVVGAEAFIIAALFILALLFFSPVHVPVSSKGYVFALLGCLSLVAGTFFFFYSVSMIGSFQFSLLCKIEPISPPCLCTNFSLGISIWA